MLRLTWQSLERGEDPVSEAGFAGCCRSSIEPERSPEHILWLERIIIRCFELRNQLPSPEGEHGRFAMTLTGMLISLCKVDRGRFTAILQALRVQCGEADIDSRQKLLSRFEKLVSRSGNHE